MARPTDKRSEAEIFAELSTLCASPGYAHAIAFFCFRDNLIRFGDMMTPKDLEHQHSAERLVRTEISTLIGLLVRAPIDLAVPDPKTLDGYVERTQILLLEIHHALSAGWFEGFDFTADPPIFADPFTAAENLREPIFYGGESAYGFQYRDLSIQKYGSDDDWLEANRGFRIADAVAVARALERILPDRQLAILQAMREKPAESWTFLPAFEFSSSDVAEAAKIDTGRARAVLLAFTLPVENRNPTFTGLSEFNATNATPVLRTSAGRYLLFQHYSLLEALYESPFFWMGIDDKAYAPTALKHRGEFTEQFVAERLRTVFGSTRVFTNVVIYRPDGSTHGEIDVLVLFGDRSLVVQAKSKRLTIEARKGNDLQLKDDFKRAVQNAYDQAYLCALAMLDPSFTLRDCAGLIIDRPAQLRAILPLCVVSDHYPALAFQARQFLDLRTTDQILNPLVTDVFAIDVMAEMLATPLHFLHYLHLRARFGDVFVASQELTLLGYHLRYNLWGDGKYDMMSLADDFSVELDIAMFARRDGVPGQTTPEGILTRLVDTTFGRLVSQIEASGDPQITDLGIWLLSLSEDSARDISKGIDRIVAMTRQDKRTHDITVGAGDPPSGITVHCSYAPPTEAIRKLMAHANLRKHSMKADAWYALIVSPEDGAIVVGAVAKFPWQPNAQMDELLKDMPRPVSPREFHQEMSRPRRIGRNELCTCGSGKKFKKCCLGKRH